MKDTDGKTIAYSTNGASTHGVVLAFIKELNLKAKPVATGSPASTLTQVMSGQVDVGWASPPFGIKEMDENKIRVLALATDLPVMRGQSIRVLATNAEALAGAETRSRAMSMRIATRLTTCMATIRSHQGLRRARGLVA